MASATVTYQYLKLKINCESYQREVSLEARARHIAKDNTTKGLSTNKTFPGSNEFTRPFC